MALAVPAAVLFDFLADPTNDSAWMTGVHGALQLDEGPIRLGTRFRQWGRALGRTIEVDWAVLELDRPSCFAIETTRSPVPFRRTYRLLPDEKDTVLAFIVELDSGLLQGPLLHLLSGPVLEAAMQIALRRLRDLPFPRGS